MTAPEGIVRRGVGWVGYGRIPRQLLQDTSISRDARLLYGVIEDHCDRDDSFAWPGQKRLADLMGSSIRSVKRWLAELVGPGWITVHVEIVEHGRRNIYEVNAVPVPPRVVHSSGGVTDGLMVGDGDTGDTMGGVPDGPRSIRGGTPPAEAPDFVAVDDQSSSARVPDPVDDDGTNPQPPEPTEHPERHPERLRARLRAVLDEAGLHDEPIPPQLVAALQVALRGNPAADDYQFHQLARCATHLSVARHPLNYLARVVQDLVNYDPSDF